MPHPKRRTDRHRRSHRDQNTFASTHTANPKNPTTNVTKTTTPYPNHMLPEPFTRASSHHPPAHDVSRPRNPPKAPEPTANPSPHTRADRETQPPHPSQPGNPAPTPEPDRQTQPRPPSRPPTPAPTAERSEGKGVRVAEPPLAASEAQPQKMPKATRPTLSAGTRRLSPSGE